MNLKLIGAIVGLVVLLGLGGIIWFQNKQLADLNQKVGGQGTTLAVQDKTIKTQKNDAKQQVVQHQVLDIRVRQAEDQLAVTQKQIANQETSVNALGAELEEVTK